MLDFYEIPYVGPRNPACVLSFDKEFSKFFAKSRGVLTLDYQVLYRNTPIPTLEYPVIIKPSRLGSSLGISVVESQEDLQYALDSAFEYDEKVLIEPFIAGIKEYNLAGYKSKEGMRFSFIEEPEKNKFLDFDKKYLDFSRTSNAKEAEISENLKTILKENDVVSVKVQRDKDYGVIPEKGEVEILYEDDYVIALNKPASLPES